MFTEFGRALLHLINHFAQEFFGRDQGPPTDCTPEPEPQQQHEPEQPQESPEPEDRPSTYWQDQVSRSRPQDWARELQRWLPQEQQQERDGQEQEHDQDHGRDR
jgi:hypothetical protein